MRQSRDGLVFLEMPEKFDRNDQPRVQDDGTARRRVAEILIDRKLSELLQAFRKINPT